MKSKLQSKTLSLFFSKGMSLKQWDDLGMLEREILLYKELSNHFGRIYFFTYGDNNEMKYQKYLPDNIRICPKVNKLPLKLYSILLPFFYIKEIRRSDILKTNQMSGSWAAVLASWISGAKLVVRCGYEWLEVMERRKYSFWKLKLATFLESLAYKSADIIVFSNEADKEFARKRFGLSADTLVIIPNFVNSELFKPIPVTKEKNRIIFVGKLEEQKNIFQLIEAIYILQVRLIIIGNGSLRGALERFVKEKNAPVEFWGNISNSQLPEELNKSELFILPSLYEGHPKVLLEAMSCGLPCIGTNVKGIGTIIEHEKNGYLCETKVEAIRSAIEKVLNDSKLQARIGKGARDTVLSNFGFQKIVQMELNVYNDFIQ